MHIESSRIVSAPASMVFDTVAHIENFADALPHIVDFEYLTENHRGVGTRFRETRLMGKRNHLTELLVTEYDPDRRTRMVAHGGGSEWDTVFEFHDHETGTEFRLTMIARAKNPMAWLFNKLIRSQIQAKVECDLDYVKTYCESLT